MNLHDIVRIKAEYSTYKGYMGTLTAIFAEGHCHVDIPYECVMDYDNDEVEVLVGYDMNMVRANNVIKSIKDHTWGLYLQSLSDASKDDTVSDFIECVQGVFLDEATSRAIRSRAKAK